MVSAWICIARGRAGACERSIFREKGEERVRANSEIHKSTHSNPHHKLST